MAVVVLAIDPGNEESAFVVWDGASIIDHGKMPNDAARIYFRGLSERTDCCVIEQIKSYGMSVGASVFETCVWTGRFMEAYGPERVYRIPRLECKVHLCRSAKAKDGNVRQALIDLFGGENAIGKKKTPGPLYGIKSDTWAALAVAVTWYDLNVRTGVVAA